MRVVVEWQTETVTTYRAEVEVPEHVTATGNWRDVDHWVHVCADNDVLIALEETTQPEREEFTREVVDWQGVEGTYGPEQRIVVRMPS